MKKQKVSMKLLLVRGHQICEQAIKTDGTERGLEILYNLRRNAGLQMVGLADANGKKYYIGNVVPMEKLQQLNATPNMSSWDHLTIGMLKYKVETDPTKHVVQVNAKDPIWTLIDAGDVVMDPLMNQVFPPVKPHITHKGRE